MIQIHLLFHNKLFNKHINFVYKQNWGSCKWYSFLRKTDLLQKYGKSVAEIANLLNIYYISRLNMKNFCNVWQKNVSKTKESSPKMLLYEEANEYDDFR